MSAHKQVFCHPISPTVAPNNGSPKLVIPHADPGYSPKIWVISPPFRVCLLPRSISFYMPGVFSWLVPRAEVKRNFRKLGNPTVPLLGVVNLPQVARVPPELPLLLPNRDGVLLPATLNSRGRGLVKKERSFLFKSCTIFEEWQASVPEPIPSRTPRENPHHPLPD